MTTGETERDYIQSIERGFAVLRAFDADRPSPTLAEIAAATELSRPTVRRILITLQKLGYVHGAEGRWRLTPRVLSIAQHYSTSNSITDVAQPHLLELAENTEESASLSALDGTEVVYIGRVPVRRIMSVNVALGTRVPAYATSMGRVLLAWAPANELDRVIEAGLPRHTRHTITDPIGLRQELRRVRSQGWAIVASEIEEGVIAVSAPVRDQSGAVVAALASATSSGRSDVETLRREVMPVVVRTAQRISEDLGLKAVPGHESTSKEFEGFF
ncbi:helix-turn-helix domain-containing protein [Allosaccharopolyspora coralli]|uniref:Glycerol operon regulatory protein n=1 Tax=Allosaccharopolyspora coralli TaxID=2665642 RepID=A0A5Q3Q945_9PSEU|nr:IclR family transcriptional regulator C-terminal domain-containing protein [Allosaccharopolyspora coralli]QGK70992.1 helix-turn-helix domain-containing protein [Allosaccharopolyspora coralli]